MADGKADVAGAHAAARREAEALAGGPGDLPRRAEAYRGLYRASAGNHVFPLVAAHGALWGLGYFALGMRVGAALSLPDLGRPALRRERIASLAAFADAFREINRRVFVEVWTTYALTATHGDEPGIGEHVDPVLLAALNRCHHARRSGVPLDRVGRGELFEAFFRWEQREVVGPAVDAAVAAFDWPLAKGIALTPTIRFAYMAPADALRFRDFASADERIAMGLRAQELAERAGWGKVEADLARYGTFAALGRHVADAVRRAPRPAAVRPSAVPAVA